MALKDLLTDLSNFKYTDYGNAGSIESQVSGRHGTPDAPIDNSDFDNGVGFGVDPNSTAQSFNVRGYTITGDKRFIVNFGGDIVREDGSIYGMGEFNSILTPFDHTQMRDTSRVVYNQYTAIDFGDSLHTQDNDTISTIGGGVDYYGNLLPITPRGSIYRDDSGNYQVPQKFGNTNPPGTASGIRPYLKDQTTFNLPQHTSTGPTEFQIQPFSDDPIVPDAHGSGFMNRLPYDSKVENKDTLTHNVNMINLTGPFDDTYQTSINLARIAVGAHGSDFLTTPIAAFSSRFANQNEFLMNSVFDSGFSTDDFYVDSSNRGPTSFGTFKQFTKSDNSLKRISLNSPNSDPDGNEFYTFPDRLPYDLDARDNTIFGFDQPFILKDIGDKWGPNIESTLDGGLVRGGVVTSVARGLADASRLAKFILTPKGILFGLKQAGFQLLNPRAETRIWNPLSLGSGNTTVLGVPLRLDRHLGGVTYEQAIKPLGSTLDQYGTALTLPVGQGPAIAGVTLTRVTLAHLSAMVPSAGGKVSLPAVPEISVDALSLGNLTSLSPNTFPQTDGIGNRIPNLNKYRSNKGYTNINGTSTLPARNPEAGFKDTLFASRFAGSPLTELGVLEENDGSISFPPKSVTDNVLRAEIFDGNQDSQGSPYFVKTPSDYLLGEIDEKNNVSVLRSVAYGNPIYGTGTQVSIFNPLSDTQGEINFRDKLSYRPLDTDYPANLQIRRIPNEDDTSRFSVHFLGNLYGDFQNPTLENPRKKYIPSIGTPTTPVIIPTNDTGRSDVDVDNKILYLGYQSSIAFQSTQIFGQNDITPGVTRERKTNLSANERPDNFSTLAPNEENLPNLTRKNIKGEGLNHDGRNKWKDNRRYPNALIQNEDFVGLLGVRYDNSFSAEGDTDNPEQYIIEKGGIVSNFNSDIFNYKDVQGSSTPKFRQELYKKGAEYAGENRPQETVDNSYLTQLLGEDRFGRLGTDDDGDPIVNIRTAHVPSPNNPQQRLSKFSTDIIEGNSLNDVKLQNFPLLNDTTDGNRGLQGQALGFLGENESPIKLASNPYGPELGDKTTYNRLGFSTLPYEKSLIGQSDENVGQKESKFKTEEGFLPRVLKKLFTKNDNTDKGDLQLGDNQITANLPSQERTVSLSKGKGNAIDRYRTLAYGDLPSGGNDSNRYEKREDQVIGDDFRTGRRRPLLEDSDGAKGSKFTFAAGVGYIKTDGLDNIRGDLSDKFDRINMTPYGEDNNEDYIKFKFFDEVNKKHIIFPATLKGFNDTFSPEYSGERYIGRPDQVWVYQSTQREISFDFDVAALSKQQLLVCWEKLNYLAGLTYPNWKSQGTTTRMQAPFISLTIGDMLNRTPGYINSLTFNVEDTTTWDIDPGFQLPKIISVNCTFVHIGKHPLANRGVHYDLPWLKTLNRIPGGNPAYQLGNPLGGEGARNNQILEPSTTNE